MKRTAVYIATTEGPADVQRITPEDSDVRSVVCHDGKAIALPISADYDSFVRRPTGVIQACFGHSAYRVDVGGPIASGLSWQLGLFVAHALYEEGRLALSADAVPQVVWATGEVTRDLAVAAVDDVDRKMRLSESRIRAHLDGGSRVVLAVPAGNTTEAARALEDVFGNDRDRLQLVAADTVCDVLAALGLRRRRRTRRWLSRRPSMARGRRKWARQAAYGVSVALLTLVVVAGWHRPVPQAEAVAPAVQAVRIPPDKLRSVAAAPLKVVSVAVRPPDGKPCAAVHLGRTAPQITRRAVRDETPPVALRTADLCDFRYGLTNRGSRPVTLWVMAERSGAGGEGFRLRPVHAERRVAAGQSLELDARPPRALSAPLRQAFTVVSLPADRSADLDALRAVWRHAHEATSADDLGRTLAEARIHGAAVQRLREEFNPQTPREKILAAPMENASDPLITLSTPQ